ncbi:cytidine deaminase [Candidatus Babeliales bacterium]|nr:cytidine deaminase [Candidatus Babeliales bacterium]
MTSINVQFTKLLQHATEMQQLAICSYSKFPVGASLLTDTGIIIGGCNIESISYGLTMCAERVAIFSALAQGYKNFTHLALVTNSAVFPCGACRQMIYEFCPQAQILIAIPEKIITTSTAQELMPHAFCNFNSTSEKRLIS